MKCERRGILLKRIHFHSGKVAFLCALFSILIFILMNSLLDASQSSAQSKAVLSLLEWLLGVLPFLTHSFVRALAHFLEYTLLGAHLFFLPLVFMREDGYVAVKKYLFGETLAAFGLRVLRAALMGLAFACIDEFVQYFVPGRSSSVIDVLTDGGGVLCGIAFSASVAALYLCLAARKTRKVKK